MTVLAWTLLVEPVLFGLSAAAIMTVSAIGSGCSTWWRERHVGAEWLRPTVFETVGLSLRLSWPLIATVGLFTWSVSLVLSAFGVLVGALTA